MDWQSNKKTIEHAEEIKIGYKIAFERKGRLLEGLIINIRENSVIVELKQDAIDFLNLENELTVVRHNNYTVI